MAGEPFEPDAAMAGIRQAEERDRSGRRWRAGVFAAVGLVTIGYLAVLGAVHYRQATLIGTAMTLVPVLAVIAAVDVLNRHRVARSQRLMRREYALAAGYAVLVAVAGLLAVLLPHPLPAALSGVLPALLCFAGAWQTAARR